MTISYPLTLPGDGFVSVDIRAFDVVGVARSPFTLSADTQQFGGQQWEADFAYPPQFLARLAPELVAFLVALKGRHGSFLAAADPLAKAPRGTWAGSPLVMGAHAAGSPTLAVDGFTAGATVKAMDYVQVGTGASSRLHQVLTSATESSGAITLDIWPNLRAAVADNAAIVTSNPKGKWHLASNERKWSIATAQRYGIAFSAVEDLR